MKERGCRKEGGCREGRDEGRLGPLGLDAPVTSLIPEFAIESPYPSARGITLRALAMHASGLPREHPVR